MPDISEVALGRIIFAVRKTAHVTEYAILAGLVWRALRNSRTTLDAAPETERHHADAFGGEEQKARRPWRWSEAVLALGLAALYAGSDEIHQYFVPTREARFGDVMLDSSGAAVGLFGIWVMGKWRRRW